MSVIKENWPYHHFDYSWKTVTLTTCALTTCADPENFLDGPEWAELSSERGELSSECGRTCLKLGSVIFGASCLGCP